VVLASNGKEALDKASREFFHLILMDIQMPVMDGLESSRKIQELKLENPPAIIAMTAYVMNEDKKRFLEAGMDDFIPKPISGDKILSKVRHWTEKSLQENPLSETEYQKQDLADNQLRRIFDFEVLKSLKKHLGEDVLLASVEEFASELRELLILSETSAQENNLEELQRCFHTLKGNAGTFGLLKIAEIAKELENEVKNGNIAGALSGKSRLEESASDFLNSYTLLYTDYEWKN
jgi:CheY-like chemotaxis protein/HPt (histidine-containing phosphotransfer) domain-containing protein